MWKSFRPLLIAKLSCAQNNHPYITMIRHFISSNWEMKKYCLQAHYLPEDHTAVNILVVLSETLQQ